MAMCGCGVALSGHVGVQESRKVGSGAIRTCFWLIDV